VLAVVLDFARDLTANLDEATVSAGARREILGFAPLAVAIAASITHSDMDAARRTLGETGILFPDGNVTAGLSIIWSNRRGGDLLFERIRRYYW
jgi:hypothetical protein